MRRPAAWRYAAAEDEKARGRVSALLDAALETAAQVEADFDEALDWQPTELDDDGLEVIVGEPGTALYDIVIINVPRQHGRSAEWEKHIRFLERYGIGPHTIQGRSYPAPIIIDDVTSPDSVLGNAEAWRTSAADWWRNTVHMDGATLKPEPEEAPDA